jgi:RNA polymerase sigma-70 factor (ECF subfamily)
MEELQLIELCKQNDVYAFEQLILAYETKIYNLCFYVLKNKDDAMDASQEVCIKIFKSISKFKGDSKFSTWVYRVTYNTCIDYIKKRKEDIPYDDVINIETGDDNKVDSIVEAKELKQEIKNCIMNLNEDFRAIIILRDIEGLSYQEISGILNIEVGTVKSRLSRARENLKNQLIKNNVVRRC